MDELGHAATDTFDAYGHVTAHVEVFERGENITTSFAYDASGNLTTMTDNGGHV